MQKEIWKDVPNYEGIYQVSNLGNVKSLKWGKENLLNDVFDKQGYLIYSLHKNKIRKDIKGHQLVAMAFLNHMPDGTSKLVVDHINDIKSDNRLENLQIITQRENAFKTQGKYSSKYKGVCWVGKRNKWMASIYLDKKSFFLGYFINEHEAHLAYQNKLNEVLNGN